LMAIDYAKIAEIYDRYVTADFDIPFWIRETAKMRGKVLELASGTGRVSMPLLRAGVDLTCVDSSHEMLAILREKVERESMACSIVEMDISELSLPLQYDFIFIPFNTFSEITDWRKQREVLTRVRHHLAENGEFVCTLRNPAVAIAGLDGNEEIVGTFPLDGTNSLVVKRRMSRDSAPAVAHGIQTYEFHDEAGRTVDRRSIEVSFCLPGKEEFEGMAAQAGLTVQMLYGDYNYTKFKSEESPYMIWMLKSHQL
jgi:SAM-dependent methyltransferase